MLSVIALAMRFCPSDRASYAGIVPKRLKLQSNRCNLGFLIQNNGSMVLDQEPQVTLTYDDLHHVFEVRVDDLNHDAEWRPGVSSVLLKKAS